jgi:hypothetical protein
LVWQAIQNDTNFCVFYNDDVDLLQNSSKQKGKYPIKLSHNTSV